jgi:hypothetical protein
MIMPADEAAAGKRKVPASRVVLKTFFADGDHICQVDQEYANNCRL